MLNINIRVAAAQARQAVKAVEGDLKRMQGSVNGAAGAGAAFNKAFDPRRLANFGKNLQWTGRQLEFSFTLPLMLAAGAATKWSLENQRAMVGVRKVYGDGTESAAQLSAELNALERSFVLLSNRFGVHQKEVIEIADLWAAAGSAGVGLARATRLTLETMILGVEDAKQATEGLIGIQAAYSLSTEQLTRTVADLNLIENQTGISLGGLIETISRAGGMAKVAGISIQQLSAYAAAIVPAAGSAAQAGNALRTIISRIMAPTKESSELMARMGINIMDASWQSQNAVGRIKTLADSFMNLSDGQKNVVSSSIASRWQINRFALLMEQIAQETGFYAKALAIVNDSMDTTTGKTKAQIQMQRELLTALESDPKKFDIIWNTMRNTMASTIQPIIPYIILLFQKVQKLVEGFSKLSPEMKQAVTAGLLFLIVLGPIARYIGAVTTLLGTLGTGFKFLNKHLIGSATKSGLFAQLWAGTWKLIVDITRAAAINTAAIVDMMMQKIRVIWAGSSGFIARIWGAMWRMVMVVLGPVGRALVGAVAAIGRAMNFTWAASIGAMALPPAALAVAVIGGLVLMVAWIEEHVPGGFLNMVKSIARVLGALPKIVGRAFMAVVRVIQRAMDAVAEAFTYLNPFARHSPSLVENVIAGVSIILSQYERLRHIPNSLRGALRALNEFREAAGNQGEEFEFQQQRAEIVAFTPGAADAADKLWATIKGLRRDLVLIQIEITAQENVVARWENALKAANKQLDAAQKHLDALEATASRANDALQNAKGRLDDLRDIQLTGWYEMDEAIFQNQVEVNKLRLAILRMEEAGLSVDDINKKLSAMSGEIEMLKAEATSLREAGAGSDVLGPLEEQIALMEQQRSEMERQGSPISDMQKQLEELQRQGEILDLEKMLKFDPLRRQIDQVGKSMEELPFDELYAQLIAQQKIVEELEASWRLAEDAVKAQESVVDQLKTTRDGLQEGYDREKDTLDQLKDAYSVVENAIREMESAISDAAAAAGRMAAALKDSRSQAEQLFDAAEGFDFPDVGGTTGIGREGGLFDIEQFNKDMEREIAKAMKGMSFKLDLFKPIKEQFKKAWEWIKNNSTKLILGALIGIPAAVILGLTGIPALIFTAIIMGLYAIFGDKIGAFFAEKFEGVINVIRTVVEKIVGFFQWLWDVLVGNSIIPDMIMDIIEWFAKLPLLLLGVLADAGKWLLEVGANIVKGLIEGYLAYLKFLWNAIGEIAKGIARLVSGAARWLWNTGIDIVKGLVEGIGSVLIWIWNKMGEIGRGIANLVAGAGRWLWDTGISIVRGLVDGIGSVLGWIWDKIKSIATGIWNVVSGAGEWLLNTGKNVITGLINGIGSMFGGLWARIREIPGGIWSVVSNAGDWLLQTGKNIIIGLWNGIAGMGQWLWDRVTGFAKRFIPGPIARALGIDSPSKVAANMGKMVGMGLAGGLMAQTDHVAAAAKTLANAAIPEISSLHMPNVSMGELSWRASVAGGSGTTSMNTDGAKRELHFHGNLEFPNITDPADAEAFIRNLESLNG